MNAAGRRVELAPSGDIVEEGQSQQTDEDGTGGRRNIESHRHVVSPRRRDRRADRPGSLESSQGFDDSRCGRGGG